MQAQTALLRDPRSVGVARRFETAALVAADVPTERVHTAALLRSELVGNAVLRAPSGIELSVACRYDWARVDVGDGNPRGLGALRGTDARGRSDRAGPAE